jgi:hypothetical protein
MRQPELAAALLTLVVFLLAAGYEILGRGKGWTPSSYFDL